MGQKKLNGASDLLNTLLVRADIPIKEEEPKQKWDDVDNLYMELANSIVDIGSQVNETIRAINAGSLNNVQDLTITINGINRDLLSFTEDLIKIRSLHADKTGFIVDENDHALCLAVFNDYVMLNDRFRAVIYPSTITMTEILFEAMQSSKTDTNVVTDVAFKETPKEEINNV